MSSHFSKYSSTVVLAAATTVDNLIVFAGRLTTGLFIAGNTTGELRKPSCVYQVSLALRIQSILTY